MARRRIWSKTAWIGAVAAMLLTAGSFAAPSEVTITVYLREWPPELEWENEMIAQFERENPDIDVEVIKDAGQYHDKLNLLWSTGNPPDIWDHGGRVREYYGRGWLLDLMPYIKRDAAEIDVNDFFPAAWKAYQIDGKFIAMPFVTMGSFFFINKDLLAQSGFSAPSLSWDDPRFTWDEMASQARKLTRLTADGRAEQFGVDLGSGAMAWQGLGIQYLFGGDRYDQESYATGLPNKPTMKTPANIRAFTEYLRLLHEDRVAPGGATPWARSFSGWSFLAQKVTMAWTAGHVMNDMTKTDVGFDWTLAPLPRTAAGRVDIVYTDPWMISSRTKQPEAAWRFVKFITGKQATADYASKLGFAPARRSSSRVFIENITRKSGMSPADLITALSGAQTYGRESIDHIMFGELEIEGRLAPILNPMLRREVTVEAALENADRVLAQTFAEVRKQALR